VARVIDFKVYYEKPGDSDRLRSIRGERVYTKNIRLRQKWLL